MAEIHLDFLNFNSILIILLLFLIAGYLYYEIHKLKTVINEIQYKLNQRDDTIIRNEGSLNYLPCDMEIPESRELSELSESRELSESQEVAIEPPIQSEDSNWDHIHRQMEEDDNSISSDTEDNEGKEVTPLTTPPLVNNSADIDEILEGKNIISDNSLSDILNVDNDLTKIDEFINTIKENEYAKVISTDYDKMTVSQLKKILSDKDLAVSGNKTKLIERIKENNT